MYSGRNKNQTSVTQLIFEKQNSLSRHQGQAELVDTSVLWSSLHLDVRLTDATLK